jgi:hypothetical protein
MVDSGYVPSFPFPSTTKPKTTTNPQQIVLVIRFSIIPSHFSTAVFSTCDVNFWFFAIATFITLPKQIILVYVGVLLTESNSNNTLNYLVAGGAFIITVFAGWYIYSKMQAVKKILLEEQDQRKRDKLDAMIAAAAPPPIRYERGFDFRT